MAIATIRDVARLADVSIKTVSRVINNEANVRDKTRKRVQQVVEELEYHPHPNARGLGANRSFALTLLMENPDSYGYTKRIIDGVLDVCNERNYTLLLQPTVEEPNSDSIRRYIKQRRVDGVILPPPLCDDQELRRTLRELQVKYVSLSPRNLDTDCYSVYSDDEQALSDVVHNVHQCGHRRVGFIEGKPQHGSTIRRSRGFKKAIHGLGLDDSPELIAKGEFDFESGYQAGKNLLSLTPRPTVIVASNDEMANGVMIAARQLSLELPQELSVVGFDDSAIATQVYPALTTMRQPIYEMACDATGRLIDQFQGLPEPATHRMFKCSFIKRESLVPPVLIA